MNTIIFEFFGKLLQLLCSSAGLFKTKIHCQMHVNCDDMHNTINIKHYIVRYQHNQKIHILEKQVIRVKNSWGLPPPTLELLGRLS